MRHAVKGKQLNRNIHTRRALFKNLLLAIIAHGKINTTLAKAKAIQGEFEHLVTKAKEGTVPARRSIDQVLNQKQAVNQLVDVIAPAITRQSGYTRIVKLGQRRGDAALIVRLEIIDWQPKVETIKPSKKKAKADKKAAKKAESGMKTSSKAEDKLITKTKLPVNTGNVTKHIPQKRSTGGGK
jgi:large subunit ribosomal protein L17